MANEFDRNEDMDEEMSVITMTDEETGEEIEFVVIDRKNYKGLEYILVIESKNIDDDEAEAAILKVVGESEEEITYSVIDDDDEFEVIAELFDSDEYDVEY